MQDSEVRRGDPGSWWADSMCRQHPTQLWFAGGHRETMLAKRICAGCAVREECLEFALGRPELLGVWAATTPNERTAMRRASVRTPFAVDDEINAHLHARADLDRRSRPERALALAPEAEAEAEPAAGPDPEPGAEPDPDPDSSSAAAPEAATEPAREREPRPAGESGDRRDLLTPAEAARLLGVTPNTVTRWSRAGKVAAIQTMGGHRRFRRAEVERVLREANLPA